ncbi:MAG: hypothetical protein Q7S53_02535 [bacterium]|nr:hypothetical protein [bacterium]
MKKPAKYYIVRCPRSLFAIRGLGPAPCLLEDDLVLQFRSGNYDEKSNATKQIFLKAFDGKIPSHSRLKRLRISTFDVSREYITERGLLFRLIVTKSKKSKNRRTVPAA